MAKTAIMMMLGATATVVLTATAGAQVNRFTDLRYTFTAGSADALGGPADLTASAISFTDPANMGVSNGGNNVFIRGDVTDGDATVADPNAVLGTAFVPTDFLSWTIDVDPGSQLELDRISFAYWNELTDGGNYSVSFALRSSIDGFASDLFAVENFDSNTPTTEVIELDPFGTDFEGLTGSVEFRLFTYGDNRFNGGNERSRLDSIFHVGETSPLSALLEGDYNSDGFVSQGDLDLVLLNWGDTTAPDGLDEANLPGGGSFDGLISQNELDGVLLNWGNGTSPAVTAVPEPTSLALLGLGGVAVLARRRQDS